jgi:hypothetical protein
VSTPRRPPSDLEHDFEERLGLMGVLGTPTAAQIAEATRCAEVLRDWPSKDKPQPPPAPFLASQTALFGAKR